MPMRVAEQEKALPDRVLFDEKQAAAFLDLAPNTLAVWRCTKRHDLPFVRVGRLVKYRRSDLVAWIERNTVGASEAA